jgi:hypothetical protein
MKNLLILSALCLSLIHLSVLQGISSNHGGGLPHRQQRLQGDSLPHVFASHHGDLIESRLRNEAILKFTQHQLPKSRQEWETYQRQLRDQIIKKAGIVLYPALPLDYQETGVVKMEGFTIKNILFQTRPGVYATANLYVPDGPGPFPAVINLHGHWAHGRVHETPQSRGPSLALNGYVCLSVDAFGSGERTTVHGIDEYHGANLGASLMNIGESLMGIQISDNIRGVDLLASLPYVDASNIGATGASGGGNQTMWLTAIDQRMKASVPVVSVGTFESAVMRSNCVCELLVDGLTLTETSGVLALIAPRAIKMCNHELDKNPTFYPAEMKRTFTNAAPVFKMLGAENNISYALYDLEHGYWRENREAMLGWFDLHLKGIGTGAPKKEVPFKTAPEQQLLVFPQGNRDPKVGSIADYCKRRGTELRKEFLAAATFDADQKQRELRKILRIDEVPKLKKAHAYSAVDGWDRLVLETSDGKLIPLLHMRPKNRNREYVIVSDQEGKRSISAALLEELKGKESGVVLLDYSGTGKASSSAARGYDRLTTLHTQARAELWLGRTILGEWVKELSTVIKFINDKHQPWKITVDGSKESALAGLFCAALERNIDQVTLRNAPGSYLFDDREGVNFFSMGIHVPGFLAWGDVSLAAALSGAKVTFINPVTMSGKTIGAKGLEAIKTEFEKIRNRCGNTGETVFTGSL